MSGIRKRMLLAAGWVALSGGLALAQAPERVALSGARVITMSGDVIEDGVVLIERGKISAVGKGLKIPFDAREFELAGKTIFPGMVIAHTWRGLDIPNEARPITPHLDAYDAIDPSQLFFEDSLRLGHTAVHVIVGNNTVIGGVGRLLRPIGMTPDEMTIAEGAFLKISVSPRNGSDRILQMAQLREAFDELDDYLVRLAEKRYDEKRKEENKEVDVGPAEARKRGRDLIRAEDVDEQHRNLLRLVGGQVRIAGEAGAAILPPLGAFINCNDAMDVGRAIEFAKAHGFFDRTVLVLGSECFKAIAELKAAARPVVLPDELVHRETDPLTGEERATFIAKKFADAGLVFALTPGQASSLPERMLTYQAARCVRYGVPRDVALRAITTYPAQALGVADRLGVIEPGKDASLVVFSGDPLEFDSVVEMVFIDGVLAYEREKDPRLQRLLNTPAPHSDEASQHEAQ